jgi:hypothetical protein
MSFDTVASISQQVHGWGCPDDGVPAAGAGRGVMFSNMLTRLEQLEVQDPSRFQQVASKVSTERQNGVVPA